MSIQLYPSNDLLVMTKMMMFIAYLIIIALGIMWLPLLLSAVNFPIDPSMFLIFLILLGGGIKVLMRNRSLNSAGQAIEINRLIFNQNNRLINVWANNNKIYTVAAYSCNKLFRSYLELCLKITPQDANMSCSYNGDNHHYQTNLYIDENMLTSDDFCRLRRAILSMSEVEHDKMSAIGQLSKK